MKIVLLILWGGVLFTMWIIYCVIDYKFGAIIRGYISEKMELKEANKAVQEFKDKRALKFKRAQDRKRKEPEYITAEEIPQSEAPVVSSPQTYAWDVNHFNNIGERTYNTKLTLSPKK